MIQYCSINLAKFIFNGYLTQYEAVYIDINLEDSKFFTICIREDLIVHRGLPELSDRLKRKITESLYEMCVNVKMHSQNLFILADSFSKNNSISYEKLLVL